MCVERFADYPQLGRFTPRDEGRTIAIGKVSGFVSCCLFGFLGGHRVAFDTEFADQHSREDGVVVSPQLYSSSGFVLAAPVVLAAASGRPLSVDYIDLEARDFVDNMTGVFNPPIVRSLAACVPRCW